MTNRIGNTSIIYIINNAAKKIIIIKYFIFKSSN